MNNELKAGVCINYVSIVIRLSTQFFLTPYIILKLGVDQYGLFMLSNSVIAWLSLTDFGLGATVSKYVVTYRAKNQNDQQAHFLGQSIMLFTVLGLLTCLCGIVCYFYLDRFFPTLDSEQYDTLKILYLLTLSNLILAFPLRPLGCVPGAYQKFVVPGLVGLATSLLNAALTVMLLYMGYKAIGLTVLGVVLGVLGLLWGAFYTCHCLSAKVIFKKPDFTLYREMFSFSFWVFLNQIMDLFYWRAGAPILARVSGAEAVTLFTLGISFTQYFVTASTAVSSVFSPKLMQMVAIGSDSNELTTMMIRVGRFQLFVLMIIILVFSFFGQDFLKLWVGKSIGGNIFIVWLGALIVLIPMVVPLTQNTGISILQALNIHKGRAVILFYTSLICVIIGYILSSFFSVIGMFIATCLANVIGQNILINIYYSKRAGLGIMRFFKIAFLPFLIPLIITLFVGCLLILNLTLSNWFDLLLYMSLYALVCFFLFAFLYFRVDERRFIWGLFNFFSKNKK